MGSLYTMAMQAAVSVLGAVLCRISISVNYVADWGIDMWLTTRKRPCGDSYELQTQETEPMFESYSAAASGDEAETLFRSRGSWQTRFSGWRGGVIASITVSVLVLLFNVALAIAAATRWQKTENIATSFTGDCTLASRWMTAIHLVINLLSSLLLGASNYCMQRLMAPTREEIDKAHAQRKWLDIGMPSMRNIPSISKHRLMPWILLALSSIPLHFVYNSVIFQTIGTNEVYYLEVTESFFKDERNHSFSGSLQGWDEEAAMLQRTLLDGRYLNRTVFENITAAECKSRYNVPFISSGSGFGVLPNSQVETDANATLFGFSQGIGQGVGGLWPVSDDISYCLTQKVTPPSCSIQISWTILLIVITCNLVKIGAMIFMLWRLNHEAAIVTVGDAIKSFLQIPDATTEYCCLMSRRTVDQLWKAPRKVQLSQKFTTTRREHWGVACSKRRWGVSIALYLGAIITVCIIISPKKLPYDGFGKVSLDNLVQTDMPKSKTSIIPFILLANLPQAIISFIYLAYNGQFTAMLAHREWSNYAIKRAPLRVTNPSPTQRSTYYLQLPYVFSVPLLLAAVALHWLISQSIFLVRIVAYEDGKPKHIDGLADSKESDYISAVGYSGAALTASLSWGSALVAIVLAVAFLGRYPTGLPVGGTNSAVISAACHIEHDKKEEEVSHRPLKWGVVIPGSKDIVGHCSFSGGEVESPEAGCLYAGLY